METNKILNADLLDIVFDERNKDYGAYQLRRSYNSRIKTSLAATALIPVILICMSFIKKDHEVSKPIVIDDPRLTELPREIKPLKPAPVLLPAHPQVKMIADLPPKIVIDILVKDPPPENKDLVNVQIGLKTDNGHETDIGIVPLQETIKGSNVIETPKALSKQEGNEPFIKTEIEARFNGDWNNYIKKEIEKHLDELTDAGESGTCTVKFVVFKDGHVSDVEVITMKGSKLAELAVNAIRKGPSWIPARQNGHDVNAYRLQPVTFRIQD